MGPVALPYGGPAPAEAFRRLSGRRGVFWLDSSLPRAGDGRYSVMGAEPRFVFVAEGDDWRIEVAPSGVISILRCEIPPAGAATVAPKREWVL